MGKGHPGQLQDTGGQSCFGHSPQNTGHTTRESRERHIKGKGLCKARKHHRAQRPQQRRQSPPQGEPMPGSHTAWAAMTSMGTV